MTACLDDYMEPSPSFVLEGRLRCHSLCTKRKIVTECDSELTEKTTMPQVMIKGFNLCEKKNPYFFFSKGLTRDYLPYNSTV